MHLTQPATEQIDNVIDTVKGQIALYGRKIFLLEQIQSNSDIGEEMRIPVAEVLGLIEDIKQEDYGIPSLITDYETKKNKLEKINKNLETLRDSIGRH